MNLGMTTELLGTTISVFYFLGIVRLSLIVLGNNLGK